jgi:lysophospholipase L1-like esterase
MIRNLALLVTTSAVSLMAGEYTARYALSDITTTTDNRSHFALKWKSAHVRLNSLGYRDKERDWSNSAGAYRIALIGDSYTFGQGLAEHERMSNLLEEELRRRRGAVDVVNLGNAGNNMADAVRVLRASIERVKPDFVLFQWFVNDVEIPEKTLPRAVAIQQQPRLEKLKVQMRRNSVLYFLAAEAWHGLLEGSGSPYAEDMLKRFGDPHSPASQRAHAALREFMQICRDEGVPLGIILVPYLTSLQSQEYPFSYLHQRVLTTCEAERVACLDLLPTFAPLMREAYRELWVNRFDSHMGPAANKMATARMLEFFGPAWTKGQVPAQ